MKFVKSYLFIDPMTITVLPTSLIFDVQYLQILLSCLKTVHVGNGMHITDNLYIRMPISYSRCSLSEILYHYKNFRLIISNTSDK